MSGKKPEAVEVQEERDIRKISSEKARKIVTISKRWRNRKVIPKAYALAIKSRLGMSRDKFRELTRMQTCHSMEMKNLDLTNKKSGFGEKNRDHGQIGYKKKYLTQRGDYL